MFDRISYKKMAREQLKGRWKIPALITLLVLVISWIIEGSSYVFDSSDTIACMTGILALCASGILFIAYTHVILKLTRSTEPVTFTDFMDGLGLFLNGILGILWYTLWVFLWSLLFVIPGIVKGISYSMMFYVMAENPGIGASKALRISKILTQGHKADLFVMGLSFLGWSLLSCLTAGILSIWVLPYVTSSFANAYTQLKTEAIQSGRIQVSDFS